MLRMKAAVAGIRNPLAAGRLGSLLDEQRPDVVLVQNLYPFLSPAILRPCTSRGIPIVMRCPNYRLFCPSGLHMTGGQVCERCLGPGRELWCLLRNCEMSWSKSGGYAARNAAARLSGSINRHVSVFVVLSEFQKRKFVQQGLSHDRLMVVPNTAPPHFFDLAVGLGEYVAFMGRVAEEKGFEQFLEIARALPGIPFAVAGEVKATALHLLEDVPSNVALRGHLSGKLLEDFLARTRVMMSCSICYEGFPNAIVQAMAAGKPVVATAIGPIPEIVEDGVTGNLYQPGDIAGAAERVRAIHGDAGRCRSMGDAARTGAERFYRP